MRYLLTPLAVLASLLLTSCAYPPVFPFYEMADIINPATRTMFEGEVRNLDYVGQLEEVEYYISGQAGSPLGDGGVLKMWYFHKPDVTLYISIAPYSKERTIYNTDSKGVSVKMMKGNYHWFFEKSVQRAPMEHVRMRRGVALTGSLLFHKENKRTFRKYDIDLSSKGSGGVSFRGAIRERAFRG